MKAALTRLNLEPARSAILFQQVEKFFVFEI